MDRLVRVQRKPSTGLRMHGDWPTAVGAYGECLQLSLSDVSGRALASLPLGFETGSASIILLLLAIPVVGVVLVSIGSHCFGRDFSPWMTILQWFLWSSSHAHTLSDYISTWSLWWHRCREVPYGCSLDRSSSIRGIFPIYLSGGSHPIPHSYSRRKTQACCLFRTCSLSQDSLTLYWLPYKHAMIAQLGLTLCFFLPCQRSHPARLRFPCHQYDRLSSPCLPCYLPRLLHRC